MKEIKTILVTTDFSETATRAAGPAQMLARKLGARVLLAHVSEPFTPFIEGRYAITDFEALNREVHARARQELDRLAKEHFEPDINVEVASLVGVPHVEIVRLVEERGVDMIVMGMHGRGFVSHALLGSTTERVLRRAPCPVLVIPDPVTRR
jgi:nucleotide-binding universal stress UspA family protein